ncbi:hypothetical protein DXG01_013718, partial [Tephrocybe rancida]
DSCLLDPSTLNTTASAPEHPLTPVSVSPPRTSSPSGSMPPTSERDLLLAAVNKLENTRQSELTELLMSPPKCERAMGLFNIEVLCAKLADAKMVLNSDDGEEEQKLSDTQSTKSAPQPPSIPVTPWAK